MHINNGIVGTDIIFCPVLAPVSPTIVQTMNTYVLYFMNSDFIACDPLNPPATTRVYSHGIVVMGIFKSNSGLCSIGDTILDWLHLSVIFT